MTEFLKNKILERVQRCTISGCWNSTWPDNGNGYKKMSLRGKAYFTHRLMYELTFGELPESMHIDHLCRNPACCNPEHLEAVTPGENTRRARPWEKNAAKTHCPHGHEYTKENTIVEVTATGRERRHCRACINFCTNRRRGRKVER